MSFKNGGGKGIRTPAPLTRPSGFQDRSLQPDLGIPPFQLEQIDYNTRNYNVSTFIRRKNLQKSIEIIFKTRYNQYCLKKFKTVPAQVAE